MFRLLLVGEHTTGSIVGFDQKLHYVGNRKRIYCAQIEFLTAEDEPVVFTYGYGSQTPRGDIDQRMPVLYDASAPEKAVVHSFMGIRAGLLAVTIPGSCLYAGIQLILERWRVQWSVSSGVSSAVGRAPAGYWLVPSASSSSAVGNESAASAGPVLG